MKVANLVILSTCLWIWNPAPVNGRTDSSDVSALNSLFGSLNSPGQLSGWTESGGDPCGDSWKGIICTGSSVTAIKLSGSGLTGTFYSLNGMTSLVELDMSSNNLGSGGGSIPYNLPPNLQTLNLASNQFTQGVPFSISQMASLEYLNLGHNQLTSISDMFYQSPNLATMDISFNSISGDLPPSFSALSSLTTLYLQNNQFTGSIDVLASLPLNDLNVANNHFTGWIPDQLKKINKLQTGGNSWSTGSAPPPPPFTPPPGRKVNPGESNTGGSKKSGIGGGGVAGIIISLLVVGVIIAFFFVRRRKKRTSAENHRDQDEPLAPFSSQEFKEMKPVQTSSFNTRTFEPPAPVDFNPPPVDRFKSYGQEDTSVKPVLKKNKSDSVKATVYSVADLQVATNSFSPDSLIGEGSVGRVFKAQLSNGKVAAIKKINSSVLPSNSSDHFLDIVSDISKLHHPNLTNLVGYCSEHGQHLLVYEFEENGSLHDLLHLNDEYSKPLSWNTRVKIALGTARALEYLHEVCSPSIVHRNLKTTNILLDSELNPHLSDSGLASLIPDSESQQAMEHSAPEVSMSGQYTLKSDVYSLGVVMLELLTGRKRFDSMRPWSEQSLVRWATPQLHDIDALDKMVDPALQGLYPAKSLSRFADVIALCVQTEPGFRPPMSEVVEALVRLVQRANMTKRMLGGEGNDSMKDYM